MSAWTVAFMVTFVLGMVAARCTDDDRRHAVAMVIAAVSIVGVTVSVQLSDLPISAFRLALVAVTVVFAVGTIHNELRRLKGSTRRSHDG